MILEDVVGGARSVAIVCNQWGDSGKGKIVDFFAEWADFVVRGTGGANAGHTVRIKDKIYVFHVIPCGIPRDSDGVTNVIGNGVVFEPGAALDELRLLDENQASYNGLKIAYNAKLILPQHILLDRLKDAKAGADKIGTTGRGIGPAYTDHYARVGLTVNDMLNKDVFRKRLERNLRDKLVFCEKVDEDYIKAIMQAPILGSGAFFKPGKIFDIDAIVDAYTKYGERLNQFICNTDAIIRDARISRKKILLEGAQGHLLSIDYGTYPFVTASDCSVQGLAKGAGLSGKGVDLVLGVVKAPYMTRVGEGPFPTEFGGEKSAEWCSSHTKQDEEKQFPNASINDEDEFVKGIAVRRLGAEYGATTGRPRRTGGLDLPFLRYAMKTNGPDIVLTKLQIFDTADRIGICTSYRYGGDEYQIAGRTLRKGDRLRVAIPDIEVLKHCTPVYHYLTGWKTSTVDIKDYDKLPSQLKTLVAFIEGEAKAKVRILSMGPERNQTIVRG
jgi:adenylosuccinate synthase